jgi:O-antigen/teichoic acid export membrane protein
MYNQIMQSSDNSKILARINIISSIALFLMTVTLLFNITGEKYYAQIYSQGLVGLIFFIYYIYQLRYYVDFKFSLKHVNYIINYGIPLIPYALSGLILNQIDRIMINSYEGASAAGLYSFAYNISMLMSIFVVSIYQAFYPRYFNYMNVKDYVNHDKSVDMLNRFTVLAAISLILFGSELGMFLAPKNFYSALSIIPIVVVGYVFEGLFTIYGRNIGYLGKNIYSTLIVLFSGVLNIVLNVVFIPIYGYKIAALTTLASYVSMAFLAWFVSCKILLFHSFSIQNALKPIFLLIPAIVCSQLLASPDFSVLILGIKSLIFLIFIVFVFGFSEIKSRINKFKIHDI